MNRRKVKLIRGIKILKIEWKIKRNKKKCFYSFLNPFKARKLPKAKAIKVLELPV